VRSTCTIEELTMATASNAGNGNGISLGFEEKLWAAADALRSDMNAAEAKHTEFEEQWQRADPEDSDRYHPKASSHGDLISDNGGNHAVAMPFSQASGIRAERFKTLRGWSFQFAKRLEAQEEQR
jgi:hypothetical protein